MHVRKLLQVHMRKTICCQTWETGYREELQGVNATRNVSFVDFYIFTRDARSASAVLLS